MERFTKEIMLSHLEDFEKLYAQRPIENNAGGMNSAHMLPLYVYLKEVKPKLVIESGVWKGQGTWLIENACKAEIISIDINLGVRSYISERSTYLSEDITKHDWTAILEEKGIKANKVLVFLDDHQNFNNRVDFLRSHGLLNVIYEDNYPLSQGDCISPKQILSENSGLDESITSMGDKFKSYEEFRPIFKSSYTRWGDQWDQMNYPTKEPLLDLSEQSNYPLFYDEHKGYTWIANVVLKK